MSSQQDRVLRDLVEAGDDGISVLDYAAGFRLASQINRLRKSHEIKTVYITLDGGARIGIYKYVSTL